MGTFDLLFAGIVKFSLIAFVLLGASLCVVRLVNQPLERIRVVQISLLAVLATLVLSVANVGPTIDLALLPASKPSETIASRNEPDAAVVLEAQPNDSKRAQPAFWINEPAATEVGDDASTPLVLTRESSAAAMARSEAGGGFAFPPFLRYLFSGVFLVVSFLHLAYLAFGFIATRRLVSGATPLSEADRARVERIIGHFPSQRHVRLATSNAIDVPMLVGLWRPAILLPSRLTRPGADPLELRHSLAHEWGHVEQHDLMTWQLTSLFQIFLWVQPCYWILRRELRVAQDQLADQFAIEQTHQHATYAATLLELSSARQKALPGALTMAGGKSNLYRRIEMLMNEKFRMVRATRKSILLSFAVLSIAAGGLLTSLQLTHAASTTVSAPTNPPDEEKGKDTVAENDGNAESAEHSGVVVDADTGKPIAGVTVTVTRMESRDWQEFAVTQSVTDENGRYTFTIPPDQLKERLLYIMFDIDHPDYAQRHCGSYGYAMIVKNLEHGEQPWFSQFKMVRGEKVAGRLVDENQQPVAGVQIRCNCVPKSGYNRVRSSWIDSVSDREGRFELMVTYDGMTKLSFIPPEHCMKHVNLGEKRGDIGDITLTTGFPIHGVVKDAVGNPMSELWVNITPEEERGEASYEMKRSARTDGEGRFESRPLEPGKYLIEVERKATGALEKTKYANFHDTPPPAMFVNRSISVTEDSARQPLVIQAVPHILISLQHFTPDGEISAGHSPSITGSFDGQRMWIRGGRRTGKGAYELMAPHGFEDAELRFTTNEQSGLMVQFGDRKLSPQKSYRFDTLEEDIDNIKVVRHPAGILKLNIVDESGKRLEEGQIFANYDLDEVQSEQMMMVAQIGWNREQGLFRLSGIVPGAPVSIQFSAPGFQTQTEKFTMKAGERRTATIKLKQGGDEAADDDK